MAAGYYPIEIEQGAAWPCDDDFFTWVDQDGIPINLTGWQGMMVFSASYNAEPFLTLATEDDGLTFGGTAGTINPYISDDDTSSMTILEGVYELKLIPPSGRTKSLLKGPFTVIRGV